MSRTIPLASPALDDPSGSPLEHGDQAIRTDTVYVVFTSIEDTLAAVRVAGDFAKALGVPLTLTHVRTVPFALPLDEPGGVSPIETDLFLRRLRAEGLDMRVHVHLCRDERRAIPLAFKPQSLIVVAGRRRWWPTESARWRRMLAAAGHFVLFVDAAEHGARAPRAKRGSPQRQPDWAGQRERSSAAA
jgi:hypothetical protein